MAGDTLLRLSHEFEQQALLQRDAAAMNAEAGTMRARLGAAQAALDSTLARVRSEVKMAAEELTRESRTTGL